MHPARRHLAEEHARLEQLSAELEESLGANRAAIQEVWTRFERALIEHFDTEERWLFPLFASEQPAEIHALREEHTRLRHLVSEEGLAADLRTLRAEAARDLLTELRAHAERENGSVYAWLEQLPEPSKLDELLEALVRRAGGIVLG